MTVAEWPESYRTLGGGDCLRALRLLRETIDDANPVSHDPLAYALQAIGRLADADRLRERRTVIERLRHGQPRQIRTLLKLSWEGRLGLTIRQGPAPEVSLDQAPEVLRQAVADHRLVILGEEAPPPQAPGLQCPRAPAPEGVRPHPPRPRELTLGSSSGWATATPASVGCLAGPR